MAVIWMAAGAFPLGSALEAAFTCMAVVFILLAALWAAIRIFSLVIALLSRGSVKKTGPK